MLAVLDTSRVFLNVDLLKRYHADVDGIAVLIKHEE